MTEQRECYITTDAQLTTVEVPPAPDAEVVMLRSELEELRSQLAAARAGRDSCEDELRRCRVDLSYWRNRGQAACACHEQAERALAEARAALAKVVHERDVLRPAAQAVRDWLGPLKANAPDSLSRHCNLLDAALAAGQPAREGDR